MVLVVVVVVVVVGVDVEYWRLERREEVGGVIAVMMLGGGRNCGVWPSWRGRSDHGTRLKGFIVFCLPEEGGYW